ncbi:MAG: hypothetical protein JW744_04615 [Candidatus Diapherotrites archaeon]|uniref:Uncharacterized protein n=1 Tax=Candidatus Iainarchaeum sp. TaxID=3101447 RepID=A0A938YV66_9ARCH|nr:hypothetical protein [Candidatus Diapherotrites archaeon]
MSRYELLASIGFREKAKAGFVLRAIGPELNAPYARRSSTSVKIKNTGIVINIKSEDPAALRAAANSIINSIILSESVTEVK